MLDQEVTNLGVPFARGGSVKPKHNAAYWASRTAGFDFSDADRVPPGRFNKVIWEGLMGGKPYPGKMGAKAVLPAAKKVDLDD
jgi:hypothetical protein